MSRFRDRPRCLTFADALERPGLLEDGVRADFLRSLDRKEREDDEAEARADARDRSGWTPLGDAA